MGKPGSRWGAAADVHGGQAEEDVQGNFPSRVADFILNGHAQAWQREAGRVKTEILNDCDQKMLSQA
jgi:hypothetical protein